MIKGTVIFLDDSDLRKTTKENCSVEDRMELLGKELDEYQKADLVIYSGREVLKNRYGKTGLIQKKKGQPG